MSFSKEEQNRIMDSAKLAQEKKGVDPRITICEAYKPITSKSRAQIARECTEAEAQGKEVEDIFSIMSEADRVRLSYLVLSKIKFSELRKTN